MIETGQLIFHSIAVLANTSPQIWLVNSKFINQIKHVHTNQVCPKNVTNCPLVKPVIGHLALSSTKPETTIQQYLLWYKTPLSPSPVSRRGEAEAGKSAVAQATAKQSSTRFAPSSFNCSLPRSPRHFQFGAQIHALVSQIQLPLLTWIQFLGTKR